MSSDTPRTDAEARPIRQYWDDQGEDIKWVVLSDFARQLERELAAALGAWDAQSKVSCQLLQDYMNERDAAIAERDQLRAELARAKEGTP